MLALNHVFLDNARDHHARLVQEWLAPPGRFRNVLSYRFHSCLNRGFAVFFWLALKLVI